MRRCCTFEIVDRLPIMQKQSAGLFVKGEMIDRLIGTTTKAHNRFVRNIIIEKITEKLVQRMVGMADD